jgi:hypothetical protein
VEVIAVAIEAGTAVDAVASDDAVDADAVDAPVREGQLPPEDAIFLRRNMLRRRAISAATIRAAATAIEIIAITAAVKAVAATTIVAIVAVRDVSTIAGPKADRVPLHHRDRAAKRRFCYRANRSRSIARGRSLLLRRCR